MPRGRLLNAVTFSSFFLPSAAGNLTAMPTSPPNWSKSARQAAARTPARNRGPRFWYPAATTGIALSLLVVAAAVPHAGANAQILIEAQRMFRKADLYRPGAVKIDLYREAEGLAEKALAAAPNSADAHFLLFAARGRRILADGAKKNLFELPGLRGSLDKAIELDPNHAHALASRGGVLLKLPALLGGDKGQALDDLQRAIVLNPSGPMTHLNLARAHLEHGDREKAEKHARMAGHYGCVLRRRPVLEEAVEFLSEF